MIQGQARPRSREAADNLRGALDNVSVQRLDLEEPSTELRQFFDAVLADAYKRTEAESRVALDQEIGVEGFFNAVSAEAKKQAGAGQRHAVDAPKVVRQFATTVRGLWKRFFGR
jgi:hypothetical protein